MNYDTLKDISIIFNAIHLKKNIIKIATNWT